MSRNLTLLCATTLSLALLAPTRAYAWPVDGSWLPVQQGGVDVVDPVADHLGGAGSLHGSIDLVGDAALSAPVAYWFVDDTTVYFRLRLDEAPWFTPGTSLRAGSWAVLLETDGDPTDWECLVGVSGSGASVSIARNADGETGLAATAEDLRYVAPSPLATNELRVTTASTALNGAPDTFLDFAVSRTAISAALGAAAAGPFRVAIVTDDRTGLSAMDNDLAGSLDFPRLGTLGTGLSDAIGIDRDADGASDAQEILGGTDPDDADSDDDGLLDRAEIDAGADPHVCDSDGDGLTDGQEAGVVAPSPDTDASAGCFQADGDSASTSNPAAADTDGGGLADGSEDLDHDGVLGDWETNPRDPIDDRDSDADGIPDAVEQRCTGEIAVVDDSDGDGHPDLAEGRTDTDGDGLPDFCDEDDDGDGLGTVDETEDDTDADGLPDWVDPDADNDGIPDGDEGVSDLDCDTVVDWRDADSADGPCADPDGDGLLNEDERACGSDPNAADSDGDGVSDPDESCDADEDCDLLPDRLDAESDPAGCATAGEDPEPVACDPTDGFLDCGHYTGGSCATVDGAGSLAPVLLALGALVRRGARRRREGGASRPSNGDSGDGGGSRPLRNASPGTSGTGLVVLGIVASAAFAPPAHATGTTNDGFDAQRFKPTADGRTLLSVEDSWVGPSGVGARAISNWASDPLVYRLDDGSAEQKLVGQLVSTDVAASLTLGRLQFSAAMPLHASWDSALATDGWRPGDARLAGRWELSDRTRGGLGTAVRLDASVPTGDSAAWLGDPSPGVGLSAIAAVGTNAVVSANVGGRFTTTTDLQPDLAWGPRATWGVGASVPLGGGFRVIAEGDGAFGLTEGDVGRAPVEVRAGAAWNADRWSVSLAGGTGLTRGVGAPDARAIASLAWFPAVPQPSPAPVQVVAEAPSSPTGVTVSAVDTNGQRVVALVRVAGDPSRHALLTPEQDGDLRAAPGPLVLLVWGEGLQPERVRVDVPDGPPIHVQVTLRPTQVRVVEDRVEIREKIFFELDSATIKSVSFSLLDDIVATLDSHPDIVKLEIQGHTDDQGAEDYNLQLSQRRADAVRDYFVANGVHPERLMARGYGEIQPLQPGVSEDAREANRRVAFRILEANAAMKARPEVQRLFDAASQGAAAPGEAAEEPRKRRNFGGGRKKKGE